MLRQWSFLVLALLGAGALAGCSSSSGRATAPKTAGYGSITVQLTDAPAAFDHIYLNVTEVWVHRVYDGTPGDSLPSWRGTGRDTSGGDRDRDCERDEDGAWYRLDATAGIYDLLDLRNGVFETLALGKVPAGTYDQLRLKLGPDNSIVVDGATQTMVVPSGQSSGFKLMGMFTVPVDGGVDLGIDMDAARSVHQTGNGKWMLRPVARIHVIYLTGGITGRVEPDTVETWVFVMQGADTATSVLTAADGSFTASLLPPGTYALDLRPTVAEYAPASVPDVVVVAGQVTDVGTITLTGPAATAVDRSFMGAVTLTPRTSIAER